MSTSSATFPIQCGSLKKGMFVAIHGHPCKVVEYTPSKPGKHGHAKATVMGCDIFTSRKYEMSHPTSHTVEAPVVTRVDYVVR